MKDIIQTHIIPELILHLSHRIHQDLQAMPPHATALLMEVKRYIPAGEDGRETGGVCSHLFSEVHIISPDHTVSQTVHHL